jgi:hypothetical protein
MKIQTNSDRLRDVYADVIDTPEMMVALSRALTVPDIGLYAEPDATVPDFDTLFSATGGFCTIAGCDCADEKEYELPPRLAWSIYYGAQYYAEVFCDNEMYLDLLPQVARHHLDAGDAEARRVWTSRFAACFLYIADCLAIGEVPFPRCTGEEMALHLALDHALDVTETDDESYNELLQTPLDTDTDWPRDLWFQDHDVLMLFDEQFDEKFDEALDDSVLESLGAANLDPSKWFFPFKA